MEGPNGEAVRRAVQAGIPLSMIRLSNALETETQLLLAGHEYLVGLFRRYLSWRKIGAGRCLLIFGATGGASRRRSGLREALGLFRSMGGRYTGPYIGRKWSENRFRAAYVRNTLWKKGYGVDTFETATDWRNIDPLKL